MRTGDEVQLTAAEIENLQPFIKDVTTADVAFRKAADWAKGANENLFNAIFEIHPELVGLALSLSHETGKVTIHGKQGRSHAELLEFLRDAEKTKNDPSV